MDRKPHDGWESQTFTYKPADEWDEHWVGLDVPTARGLINDAIDLFQESRWRGLLTPL